MSRSHRSGRPRFVGGACLLLVPLLLGPALAIGALAQEEPETATAQTVAAIGTPQIAVEADRAARTLSTLRDSLTRGAVAERIAELLPRVSESIDLKERNTEAAIGDASLGALDALESEWASLGLELPEWQTQLTDRVTEVESALASLSALEATWSVTRQSAEREAAPAAILERIASVLRQIETIRGQAVGRRSALLTLQAAVAGELGRVEGAVASISAMRQKLVSQVFERDGLPVWAPELRARLTDRFGSRVYSALLGERDELVAFTLEQSGRLGLQFGLFILLVALLRSARTRVRRRTEEEAGLGRVAEVFELPVSMALLLAILAAPWIYPYLPPGVVQILGAAALVPTVLILRRITSAPLLPLLNALIVFYFVDRVREFAAPVPTLAGVIFLAEMLGGVIFLGWLLRPSRLGEIPADAAHTQTLRAIGIAGRAALLLFFGAFFADALGYMRLGNLVGGAVLQSAYIGVVAYAGVRILDSLVTFALRVRPLGSLGVVKRSRYAMRRRVHRVLVFSAVTLWALVGLELLAIRGLLFAAARSALTAELKVGAISVSLGNILAFVVTIWLAFLLSKFIRFVLEEDVYPRLRLARGVPYATSTFAHYAILLIGFFVAVAATGMDLNRFAILLGALGVGIGFGLQNVVNNFVSGLILLSERPVQVGDTIEAGDALGEVKRIGIRSSTVRTWSGAEMIVPNSELISERVINWTLSDRQRRIDVPVGVAYGTDRRKVLALLLEVAKENEDILDYPTPSALFRGFGDSSLDFELRAWTGKLEQYMRVQSDLFLAIGEALDAAGIEIPFPQRDLHLRSVDGRAAALLSHTKHGD